jgi:hypothetical protein
MNDDIDRHTKHRMDHRTEDDFRTDMFQFTEKERRWGEILQEEFGARGNLCSVTESGVDNTGSVIHGKLANCNPDKLYVFPGHAGKMYVEIKTIPEGHNRFHTFKVSALKGCLHYGALIIVPKLDYYFMYGAKAMELMLERCDIIHNFKPFGCKPCVQPSMTFIKSMESQGLVLRKHWTPEARALIERFKAVLIADRITNHRAIA